MTPGVDARRSRGSDSCRESLRLVIRHGEQCSENQKQLVDGSSHRLLHGQIYFRVHHYYLGNVSVGVVEVVEKGVQLFDIQLLRKSRFSSRFVLPLLSLPHGSQLTTGIHKLHNRFLYETRARVDRVEQFVRLTVA